MGPHPAHHLRLQVEGELNGLETRSRTHRAVLDLQPEEAGHGVTLSVGGNTGVVTRVARSHTLKYRETRLRSRYRSISA